MPKKPTPEDDKATIAGLRADVMQISKERDVALAEVARLRTFTRASLVAALSEQYDDVPHSRINNAIAQGRAASNLRYVKKPDRARGVIAEYMWVGRAK